MLRFSFSAVLILLCVVLASCSSGTSGGPLESSDQSGSAALTGAGDKSVSAQYGGLTADQYNSSQWFQHCTVSSYDMIFTPAFGPPGQSVAVATYSVPLGTSQPPSSMQTVSLAWTSSPGSSNIIVYALETVSTKHLLSHSNDQVFTLSNLADYAYQVGGSEWFIDIQVIVYPYPATGTLHTITLSD